MSEKKIQLIGSDAGGTMTDMIMMDENGDFQVIKSPSTPGDPSIGFMDAVDFGLNRWEIKDKTPLASVKSIVYAGTTMLNAVLQRNLRPAGLIITKGFEHYFLHELGGGIHAGYGFQDKTHKVAHIHNEPFIPLRLIRGVTERISTLGEAVIPVYEKEAREAVEYLLDTEVESIVILCVFSYLNPVHEQKIAQIAREVMKKKGKEIPLYLSGELMPIWREGARLNSVTIQAQYCENARAPLLQMNNKLAAMGYKFPLHVVLSDGGLASVKYPSLFRALFSGPIGGLLGARYIAQEMNMPNLVCTDVGGTSFDVGLIMGGEPIMVREAELARASFNMPTLVLDSIGAASCTRLTAVSMLGRKQAPSGEMEVGIGIRDAVIKPELKSAYLETADPEGNLVHLLWTPK